MSTRIGQHNLISSCLQVFQQPLVLSFTAAMDETLHAIFEKAENASSNQQETELFEQYNILKKSQARLIDSLASTVMSMPDEITEQISHGEQELKLSLVEDEELEISLAFTQLESVLDIKFSKFLYALEKRLKVLFASKNISKDNMPFGVVSVCWIFSQALDTSQSNIATKVQMIEYLKKQLSISLLETYKSIEKIFVDAGILPNISLKKAPTKRPPTASGNTISANANRSDSAAQASAFAQQSAGIANAFNPSHSPTADDIQIKSSDMVNSIFDMMNQGRMADYQANQNANIDNKMLDQTLDSLSKVTSVAAGSTEIDKLKEMIINEVKNETGIYYPSLNMEQQNSLDIMGMFYQQVKEDTSIDSHILSSFNAINLPLIRTAIQDATFFENSEHPARKYMEQIIYAAQKWHGTSVVKKLHKFSSGLANSYDGSNQAFDAANEDLESYLRLTERRAKKSEEKWVNAAKGKEKLEISRHKVEEVVENVSKNAIPDFVKNVIKYVIQDALTLSLLRHGDNSEEWHKNINTSTVLSKMANPELIKELTPKQKIESLHHLDQTMNDLGFSENDRKKTLNNIKECAQAASENTLEADIELENVATINKNKKNVKTAGSAKIEELRDLTPLERTELTKIRLMPYGTLFDFITNQQRDKIRRKLSWFSPVSNKALFVSLLGSQPYEKSLNAIAIDLARKNIIVIKVEEKKYFEHVLGGIFSKLKNMVQKPTKSYVRE